MFSLKISSGLFTLASVILFISILTIFSTFPEKTGMVTKVTEETSTTVSTIKHTAKKERSEEQEYASSTTTSVHRKTSSQSTTTTSLKPMDPCVRLGCPEGTKYVGSKKSKRYHLCTCKWARRISKKNLICFEDEKEALVKGFKACKVCIGEREIEEKTTGKSSTTSTTIEENLSKDACESLGCPPGTKFVGSKKSNKYHLCTCYWASRIKPENLICFKSREEAESKGYVPCKVCKP